MAKRELVKASDVSSEGWETATFPLVCETCLGDNPYVRMIRAPASKECKICARPYTAFRWQPGRKARYKSTIVCQTCAKLKNVCQVCLFDLTFGLPVQVRDKFLEESGGSKVELPDSQVNRDFAVQRMEASSSSDILPYGKSESHHHLTLLKLARTAPYYKRNRARICTFWQRGECTRGDSCPYRHETDDYQTDPALANQNIRDRFLGINDPVANKILSSLNKPKEQPEEGQEAADKEDGQQHHLRSSSHQRATTTTTLPPDSNNAPPMFEQEVRLHHHPSSSSSDRSCFPAEPPSLLLLPPPPPIIGAGFPFPFPMPVPPNDQVGNNGSNLPHLP